MPPSVTRRQFLAQGALASVSAFAPNPHPMPSAVPLTVPIIDTHQHLWDFRVFRPPWLKGEPKLNHTATMEDYLKATNGLNIVKTIYMEVDLAPNQQVAEAEYVKELCASKKTLMAAAVVSARPALPGFAAYVKRFERSPYIKGVRQVLQVSEAQRGLCLQPDYIKSVRLLGELGLTFDICIRPTELEDAVKLVDACPDTQFVLDHCGNGMANNPQRPLWEKGISALSQKPNVICKVSGIIKTIKPSDNAARVLKPVVLHTIKAFGTDRVMFGGDWPVCNLTSSFRGWALCLNEILRGFSDVDRKRIFHDNAVNFYGLPGSGA